MSYDWIYNGKHFAGNGLMLKFWKVWQPSFDTSVAYGKVYVYLQFLPYIISILIFIRQVKIMSVEFGIFVLISLTYGIINGQPRFREPFMPLLFLFVAEPLKLYIKRFSIKFINNKINVLKTWTKNILVLPEYNNSLKPASNTFILIVYKSLIVKL